jgi:hypothetical protein
LIGDVRSKVVMIRREGKGNGEGREEEVER